ncbi:MAG: pyruvate kinase [Gammaproteobacteria bacterium]
MKHFRRTKIVVTLGPSLDDPTVLEQVVRTGADAFRCNFSHGKKEEHKKRIQMIRAFTKKAGREVAIFADLPGPKIRIARFKNKKIILQRHADFILDANLDPDAGDETAVGIDYKELPQDVVPGDVLMIDDGRIVLSVQNVDGAKIHCKVVVEGELSNNKGINRKGGGLSAKALTDKDKEDIKYAAKLDVDYFAVSFPRSVEDIKEAKELIKAAGSNAGVIAKIERAEAVPIIDDIINVSDVVMVARGDLGVEIGDAELPAVQKHIIARARALNKPVITATQMMETMIHNVIPTRAEVFDVANAVLDNTDAVMLSAETATGDHPQLVVAAMARICLGVEKNPETWMSKHRVECRFDRVDESIAMAAMYTANHEDVRAIIALTESGYTPRLMSRIRTNIPVFGLTRNLKTERKMNLYRGVYPIAFDVTKVPPTEVDRYAANKLRDNGILQEGDCVIITRGEVMGEHGHTNTMKIHCIDGE